MKKTKQLLLVSLLVMGLGLFTACQVPSHSETTTSNTEMTDSRTVNDQLWIESIEQETTTQETTSATSNTSASSTASSTVPPPKTGPKDEVSMDSAIELVTKVGNAYANYTSLQDRNKKLLPLFTEQAAKDNGIYVDDKNSGNQLKSNGKIVHIYQPVEKAADEYTILLDCTQNKVKINILLVMKIKDDKINNLTYYTLKKEY